MPGYKELHIPRIYEDQFLQSGLHITLTENNSHHINTVLRAVPGQQLILFNGRQAEEYSAIVRARKGRQIEVEITAVTDVTTESPLQVHIGQGLSRSERMDYVLQKSTELGVTEITPLLLQYSNVRLSEQRLQKRYQHWQRTIISACEQSLRARIPLLNPCSHLQDWLNKTDADSKLLFHQQARYSLQHHYQKQSSSPTSVAVLIGSEGGVSDAEVALAEANGFVSVSMGKRILRTETAPVAVLSILQFVWGDM